ncbi:MAG: CocE/NonD family hydrolase [Parachlamydiaceae bacterium]|nr:CocE/NonD family hydrolase [Parachlamydiaceae bacterium]
MNTLKYCIFFCTFFVTLISQSLSAIEVAEPTTTISIPMRDGTELLTDLYLPSPEARHLPCILLRSPAGRRQDFFLSITELAKAGYVIAIQETRSVIDKEGKTLPFISDGWGKLQDGFDTVEWLAKSPYTNGKIGTWGASALGITQLLMAPSNPPHLTCQYIIVAAASLYHHGLYPGGQLLKHQAESWLGYYARDTGVLNYVSQRPHYNSFWKQLNSLEVAHQVKVPGIHIGGWYDTFLQGTLTAFETRQSLGSEGAKGSQKLVIGPWTHFWPMSLKLGDFEVPVAGYQPPFDISSKSWFDYYLKGIDNGINQLPPVMYYVMGPFDGTPSAGNVWKTAEQWPVPAQQTPFYFNKDSTLQLKHVSEGTLSYNYNPAQPIPTTGGRNLFLESGPKDQKSIEERDDIIVFTTPVLEKDTEVTGPLSAIVYFSTDQNDTDIVLRLCDVYPDGRSILISEGVYRLGVMCCNKDLHPNFQPGKPEKIEVDLLATSIVFAKGHAIRVSVSSSNYPRYECNKNVGLIGANSGQCKIAKNTLYMNEQYPSRLILPIVEQSENKGDH